MELDLSLKSCILLIMMFNLLKESGGQTTATSGRFELTFFKNPQKTFEQAKQACEERGSHLIKVDESSLNEAARDQITLSETFGYWIGATYDNSTGNWSWTDGTRVNMRGDPGYNKWGGTEPNKLETEHCVCFGFWEYSWFNVNCKNSHYYICQRAICVPSFVTINIQPCNSSLLVRWKPHVNGVGYNHDISASAAGSIEQRQVVLPHTDQIQEIMIDDLAPSTAYTIKITGCSNEYSNRNEVNKRVVTGGIPNVVTSPVLDVKCLISWSWPEGVATGFQLTITSTLAQTSHRTNVPPNQQQIDIPATSFSHSISTLPNRNYTVQVQARVCAELGPITAANGYCVTSVAAPSEVSAPEISSNKNKDGTRSITLIVPDEENGPISCLFVIVGEATSSSSRLSTIEQLTEINSSISKQYIALVVSRSSFPQASNRITINLGDNSESTCDARDKTLYGRRKRSTGNLVFTGINAPLEENKSYGIYMVTTTPSGSEILIQSSEMQVFENSQTNLPSWIIPVAVIIPLLALIVILVGVILYIRRKKSKTANQDQPVAFATRQNQRPGDEDTNITIGAVPPREVAINRRENPTVQGAVQYENAAALGVRPNTGTNIRMSTFIETYSALVANDNLMFTTQFENLLREAKLHSAKAEFKDDPALKKKNRYKNILPYEKTRVILKQSKSGYINASYINGFKQARKFIATQGPLPTTVNDFWQMVVEQECRVIVMLAKCVEAGKQKCEKYWPECKETLQFGPITVKNEEEVLTSGFIKRTFSVQLKSESMVVHHYQFVKWPDHGIPATTSNIVRMHRAVMKNQRDEPGNGPIIVHCSAGAGRSGTFIAYDILFEESKVSAGVDVFRTVLVMRKQRIDMVQSCDQYILVHKLVLEASLFQDTECEPSEIEGLLNTSQHGNHSRFAIEFASLSKVAPIKIQKSNGSMDSNKKMNRNQAIIPYDSFEVRLTQQMREARPPYINASWVESCDESSPMIAAQGPMESTVEYFWRAVIDNNVNTIVMLTQLAEKRFEQSVQYWPARVGDGTQYQEVVVTLVGEVTAGHIIERKLEVTRAKQKKYVLQYHYEGWMSDSSPEDGTDVIGLVQKMQENIRTQTNAAALIHCSDGAGRAGAFCVIVNLIERLKLENRVDVFRAVKDLRDCRPGMVQTLDQYVFCYRAVVDYLKSFDIYSNFKKEN